MIKSQKTQVKKKRVQTIQRGSLKNYGLNGDKGSLTPNVELHLESAWTVHSLFIFLPGAPSLQAQCSWDFRRRIGQLLFWQ